MKSALIPLSCVLAISIFSLQHANADILVDLDATAAPVGALNPWNNSGTLGGTFTPTGAAAVTAIPKNDASGNVNAMTFSAATQYYISSVNVPTQVTGQGARSIEVWAYNPAVNGAEEAMVSWSRRGGAPNNSHMSFNYGFDARWGALSHWGTTNDVGWGDGNNVNPLTNATAGLFPSVGQWHYLVYTYDGTATDKLYVDGVLVNQEVVGALATAATYTNATATKFILAAQADAGGGVGAGNQGTLSLAKVKIRDNTLAAWEIRTNYNTDAGTFGRATLPGPSVKTFTISPSQFTAGQQIVITYDVPGATALSVDNGVGALTGTSGTKLITAPTNTTKFTLTATDGSGSNTATATAVIKDQIPILRHRYSFTPPTVGDTTTTTVPDSVGGLNGALKGAAFRWGEVSAAANNRAGQVVINPLAADNTTTGATATWIDLPNGLLTSRKGDFTLEGWVTCDGVQRWSRVFDFGTNYFNEQSIFGQIVGNNNAAGTDYLMLSAVSNTTGQQNVVEIKRTNVGNAATYAGAPAYGTQYHFAVVYDKDGNSGAPAVKFYRNGAFVGTIATNFNFEDFLDVNCWLGRSNFTGVGNDLNLEGSYNEFRVYDGAYTDGDAAASFALGPDVVYDPGNIQAAISKQPANVTVARNSPATFNFTPAGTPPLSIQWYRNGAAIPGATSASYTLPNATLVDDSNTFYVTVSNNIGGTPYTATSSTVSLFVNGVGQALRHRYPFSGNFVDVINGANGTGLSANATIAPTSAATSVTLAAANQQYLDLPASGPSGINMNTYSQVTFESWATFPTNAGWARLFDFGNTNVGNTQGSNYILFTPHSGANDVRMSFTDTTGGATERILTYTPLLDNLGTFHIVTIFDPLNNRERMYLNGVLAAEGTYSGPTPGVLPALSNVGNQKAFIGRSLYADPFLNANIDEFRIYNIALTSAEVAANYAAGPNNPPAAPTTISFTQQPLDTTVNEPNSVTFTADIDGPKPLTAQWYKNNALIPNATSLTYSYTPPPSDTGSTFFCRVGGIVGGNATTVNSNTVTLTVIPDTTAPTLVYAQNTNSTSILVTFSEAVSSSGNSAANYALSGGLTITSAVLSGDLKSVILTTNTALTVGSTYTLTVNNVQDRAATPNTIAANSQRTFSVTPFALTQYGTGITPGIIGTKPGGGYSLTSVGSGPSGTSDQFLLASQSKTGDFDLRVRVSELGLSDNWARAGIMARDGTLAEDSFAAAVATPGLAGCFLSTRFPAFSAATHTGSYPTNYPYTWLRLKRAGNVFTAYAGLDGSVWTTLGSSSQALSATLQVGLFASSASSSISTTGCFFDYGDVVGGTVDNNPVLPFEPDGPSNRQSTMVISEINYNPNTINGAGDLEFVELHNTAPYPEDLSGWKFKGGITYTLPNNTIVKGGGYLVVARVPADVQTAYGITGVVGPWAGSLSNTGEEFRLENENGGTMCEVDYDDEAPWPIAAAGLGHSIVLSRPSYGDSDPRAWSASNNFGGSPGWRDPYVADALRSVSINEFLANSEAPTEDFVELFNSSNSPVVVGGLMIGDGANLSVGYTIPNGTTIAARSYLSFTQTQLGFGLGSNGERLWLYSPSQRIIDALNYSGQDVNTSRNHDLKELATATPGAVNSGLKDSQVVINELMYNPITGNNADEYIELYNKGASAFSLDGWQIGGAIDFTFPVTASIPAGGYLVVAKDSVNLLTKGYAGLNSGNCLGNYTGSLPNGGGRVTLRKPFTYVPLGGGTATAYATVDEVSYSDGGRWGLWSDGGGSSLELRDARADNALASNWGDSVETAKATYTNLTITALQDNRHQGANGVANRAEFFLQGFGECLVDDISILNGATEYVVNGGFESGIGAWVAQGDQKQSSILATGAATGTNCLKLIASDRGDAGANRVRSALTATLADNLSYTLSAKVKWQRGSRYFHLRVRGNGLELPGVLNVPQNLGSPGTANSIAVANAGPAISDVAHFPVLPAAAQNVVVTARIADPDNVASASVQWRNDTDAGGTNTVAMKDDGTGGDAFSGDGLYSATIPGQATGKLVAFKVVATDAAGAAQSSTFPPQIR